MRTTEEKSVQSARSRPRNFHLDCFPFIFSIEELEILEKKGHMMKALSDGTQYPSSSEEKSFVRVCKGQSSPTSHMETAWIKYLHRRQLEASLLQTEEVYKEYMRIRKR